MCASSTLHYRSSKEPTLVSLDSGHICEGNRDGKFQELLSYVPCRDSVAAPVSVGLVCIVHVYMYRP